MRGKASVGIVSLVIILAVSLLSSASIASAPSVTLADTLNSVINNVDWSSADSWTSTWGIILANQGLSAFDSAISQDISRGDYGDALYVTRLADLNGYASATISASTETALQQMSMCGSLPINSNAHSYGDPDVLNQGCFMVYSRFLMWGYEYAEQFGLTGKWDKNKAFADFARMFDKPPVGSSAGEMLWCDPQENWAKSYSSRYYDEHAETLSVFLQFAELGVTGAMTYADKAWNGVQSHWNGQYYGYTGTSTVECEMGNFAQVIAEYRQQKDGNIANWDRVVQDLNYKLLANGWSSPGWACPGVIVHAQTNPQTRLWETMGAMTALQELFPCLTSSMKTSFDNLLMGSTRAWQGLMSSNLNSGGQFIGESGSQPSNEATVCAAAILFLDGIVPVTGSLAIPVREENYGDHRTSFLASEFQFDYNGHKIRIPVNAGQLTFIYGSTPVSYNFQTNGVYDVQFSSDWNQIMSVNGQPVTASAPSAPQNLKTTAGDAQVTLSWSAPLSDGGSAITSYDVYKGSASGAETLYATTGNVLAYTDIAVANGQTYYYKVTAVNSAGESEPSNEASATPSSVKTLGVAVGTDKATHSKWSSVSMMVTVKDTVTGNPVQGASVKVTVYYPSGSVAWTGSGRTGSSGTVRFNYRVGWNALKGTYKVVATASYTGYQPGTGQTTFNIG